MRRNIELLQSQGLPRVTPVDRVHGGTRQRFTPVSAAAAEGSLEVHH